MNNSSSRLGYKIVLHRYNVKIPSHKFIISTVNIIPDLVRNIGGQNAVLLPPKPDVCSLHNFRDQETIVFPL